MLPDDRIENGTDKPIIPKIKRHSPKTRFVSSFFLSLNDWKFIINYFSTEFQKIALACFLSILVFPFTFRFDCANVNVSKNISGFDVSKGG
jgi:hypothetical protein